MKRIVLFAVVVLFAATATQAQKLITRTGHAKIYSHTVAEDIEANNYSVSGTIDKTTGDVVISVPVQSFEFEKAAMQKHFNNKHFMNSKKYPKITFKGKVTNLSAVKFTTDGTYKATVTGDLTIRAVTKSITETATITVKDGKVSVDIEFTVKGIGSYGVGKPTSKKKENNVADDIVVTYKASYDTK